MTPSILFMTGFGFCEVLVLLFFESFFFQFPTVLLPVVTHRSLVRRREMAETAFKFFHTMTLCNV